jgi:predicted nuclease of predicted toxin-antitoxin system
LKLLFEHNLPPSLVARLRDLYPEAGHVLELGLGEAEDLEIWTNARDQGFANRVDFARETSRQYGQKRRGHLDDGGAS